MKNISLLIVIGLLMIPGMASAAKLTVTNSVTTTHGGTFDFDHWKPCVTQDSGTTCSGVSGAMQFDVAVGSYTATVPDQIGYSVTSSSCSGTIVTPDDNVTCMFTYVDGAPVQIAAAPAPVAAQYTQPQIAGTIPVQQAVQTTITNTPTEAEQIAQLQAQILELYKILIQLLQQKYGVMVNV